MAIVVNSPFSGQPVKVREEDVGRAVRDAEGRVFYVVRRSDGQGLYGSTTRSGSAKEQQRARELEASAAQAPTPPSPEEGAAAPVVHDATGRPRPGQSGRGVILAIVAAGGIALLIWLFTVGPLGTARTPPLPGPPPTQPATRPA